MVFFKSYCNISTKKFIFLIRLKPSHVFKGVLCSLKHTFNKVSFFWNRLSVSFFPDFYNSGICMCSFVCL